MTHWIPVRSIAFMGPEELEQTLARLVDMASSATARLDHLAEEVKEIRGIVETLCDRAAERAQPPAAGNPTPDARPPQAEVIFK